VGERGEGRLFQPRYKGRDGKMHTSAVWCFRIGIGGRKVTLSTGHRDLKSARAWRIQKLAALGRGETLALRSDRVSFDDLLQMVTDDYAVNDRKSASDLPTRIEHLRRHLGHLKAADITTDRLVAMSAALKVEGYSNATVNLLLSTLQRGFSLAWQSRRLSRDAVPHFPRLEVRNARKGFFERWELEALLRHLAPHLHPLMVCYYVTGWRRNELLSREWRHVDFDAGWLRLDPEETKNREGRQFPLVPELRSALERQRAYTDDYERQLGRLIPPVFHRAGKAISSFQTAWERARVAAGIPHRVVHDFRRTAVRNLEAAGVPRSAAMKMVGHQTELMYRRYAIVDEATLKAGGEKLGAHLETDRSRPAKVAGFRGRK
jgi:integrase